MELLKQPQYAPLKVEDQIISIFAATNGYLDDISEKDVQKFEKELLQFFHQKYAHIPKGIASDKQIKDETKKLLVEALKEFKAIFQSTK